MHFTTLLIIVLALGNILMYFVGANNPPKSVVRKIAAKLDQAVSSQPAPQKPTNL